MGRKKIYTDEERVIQHKKATKAWREKNKEHIYNINKQYDETPRGKANHLLRNYKTNDIKANRGEGDLTVEWIEEQIQKGCTYKDQCGTTDWRKIGLNRKDNSLPHTKANCEPCCWECNQRLNNIQRSKKVYQYTLDGKLVKIWSSTAECGRNGYDKSGISACCLNKIKTHKGYIWSYYPL